MLKELREEVLKVKRMFISNTHKMTREECVTFLQTYKPIYTPTVDLPAETKKKPVKAIRQGDGEDYDF